MFDWLKKRNIDIPKLPPKPVYSYGGPGAVRKQHCKKCKWKLRKLTGGCRPKMMCSGVYLHGGGAGASGYAGYDVTEDDMYGCDEYEPMEK